MTYCIACQKNIEARLTTGEEIYPHRPDLYSLPFWKCDTCGNYVGCHHKTEDRTKPLGVIPTKEVLSKRREIHKVLDPLWKTGGHSRKYLYEKISRKLKKDYHTGGIVSVEEADKVLEIIKNIQPRNTLI